MSDYRILVTGSRDWTGNQAIALALARAIPGHLLVDHPVLGKQCLWDQMTLVHGNARGADRIAARIAHAWGMQVEAHNADWKTYGRAAGHRRNAHMVSLGADICLAFPLGASRGTRGCMALAEKAGIPVISYEPKEPS